MTARSSRTPSSKYKQMGPVVPQNILILFGDDTQTVKGALEQKRINRSIDSSWKVAVVESRLPLFFPFFFYPFWTILSAPIETQKEGKLSVSSYCVRRSFATISLFTLRDKLTQRRERNKRDMDLYYSS